MSTHINDAASNLTPALPVSITPQSLSASGAGTALDLGAGDGGCFAVLAVGAVTGTDPTLDVKIQESTASAGTYTDISGATFTQVIAATKGEVISFRRSKRYVRAYATLGGTTPTFLASVTLHQQKKSV